MFSWRSTRSSFLSYSPSTKKESLAAHQGFLTANLELTRLVEDFGPAKEMKRGWELELAEHCRGITGISSQC